MLKGTRRGKPCFHQNSFWQLTDRMRVALDKKTSERIDKFKKPKDVASATHDKIAILLAAHLARVQPHGESLVLGSIFFSHIKEQKQVVTRSGKLVNGLLQIALSRGWLNMVLSLVDLSQVLRTFCISFLIVHCASTLPPSIASLSITLYRFRNFETFQHQKGLLFDMLNEFNRETFPLLLNCVLCLKKSNCMPLSATHLQQRASSFADY